MAEQTGGWAAMSTLARLGLSRFGPPRRPVGPTRSAIDHLAVAARQLGDPAGTHAVSIFDLPGGSPGWVNTGFHIEAGEEVTLFAGGDVAASKLLDLRFGPRTGLWYRIGADGPLAKLIGEADTFRADRTGTLLLVMKPPGEWLDETGVLNPAFPRKAVSGAVRILAVRWAKSAEVGLTALLPSDHNGLAAQALSRRRDPKLPPSGWHYLWRLGEGELYTPATTGEHESGICCHTDRDVGILQIPADCPLTEQTRLSWSWRARQLPSKLREDIQPTHDYLSIAVEFENGLDVTYMWSSELPVDTIFQCPLPWWCDRETHWVIRSDPAELGHWLNEERNLLADYRRAIGGPEPSQVVRVWLIAVSVFQRGEGKCDYADIILSDGAIRHTLA